MTNPLALKLGSFVRLSDSDLHEIEKLTTDARPYAAGRDLIKQGDRPDVVFLLLKGWACRYKLVADGGRQIMAYLIPGDLCDIHIFILKAMDHAIGLLSEATVAAIPKGQMEEMLATRPRIAQALLWSTLADEATLREWLVNLGQRDAYERIAHMFLRDVAPDVHGGPDRRRRVLAAAHAGTTRRHGGADVCPREPSAAADACGKLISLSSRNLTILDPDRLSSTPTTFTSIDGHHFRIEPWAGVAPARSVPE